jgi:cysteine desulfurase
VGVKTVYLDANATTPCADEVVAAMLPFFRERPGNPSSLHRAGVEAERAIRTARAEVAAALGREPDEVVFTSGGTEANNLGLRGAFAALRKRGDRIVATAVEHPSVLEPLAALEGARVHLVRPRPDGGLDADAVVDAVDDATVLVAVMHANNETGAVFPVEAIAARAKTKRPGLVVFSDCVQSLGKLAPLSRAVDLVSVSAHKVHGPKGAGALAIAKGARVTPLLVGGGQERGLRSGTENVPAIVGFGVAARLAREGLAARRERWASQRARLLAAALELGGVANSPADGLPSTLNVSFPGAPAEPLLHALEERGVLASSGSACASRKTAHRSHVLEAMGLDPARASSALRFSFSRETSDDDVEAAIGALREALARVKKVAVR